MLCCPAGIPRIGSRQFSLGTHMDWGSTQDSCYTGSPRSMMQRMGFSSSGSLAKQLMPWTSTGSGTLSAAASFNTTSQGPAAVVAAAMSAAAAAAAAASNSPRSSTAAAVPACTSNAQGGQQQVGMGDRSSSWVNSAVGGVQAVSPVGQQQFTQQSQGHTAGQTQVTGRVSDTGAGNSSSSSTRPTGVRHSRSSSGGGSSSSSSVAAATADVSKLHLQQQPQHQQHHMRSASLPPAGPNSSSHANSASMPSRASSDAAAQAAAAVAAAAAAAAAAAGSQITPLALAVAAAVAEHNKRQPRRWTPFALRVHQLRVAQVLLAERQKQVAAQQQPPAQEAGYQLQHPVQHVQPQQPPPAPQRADEAAPAPTEQGTHAAIARATEPAGSASSSQQGRADGHMRQAQAQLQQREDAREQHLQAPAPGVSTEGTRGQKPAKKKWLTCFAPRAFS